MATETDVYKLAIDRIKSKDQKFTDIAKDIVTANQNKKLAKQLTKDLHHILNVVDMSELKTAPQSATGNTANDDVTFQQIIKGLLTRRVTTTAHRKELISDLVGNIPAKGMSIKSATEAIEMIDAVAERSHSYTIASPEIVGAINSCIYTICSEQKLNWEAFIKKHGSLVANFLQKMKDANREKKIYQPGRYKDNESKIAKNLFANLSVGTKKKTPPPVPQKMDSYVLTDDWDG